MATKLFVGGISYTATNVQLEDHFKKVGTVVSANLITDRYTGQGKGFGFIEMATEEEAQKAIKELNNSVLEGRPIVVKIAVPKTDSSNGGSFNNKRN